MIKNLRSLSLININQSTTHKLVNLNKHITTSTSLFDKEWSKTLTKAEKIVGYPTSFLNLRYLVSDEVANFANLLRKLMKTKHPLIKMARRLISIGGENETKRSLQINGLLVLLIAKAAGVPRKQSSILDVEISDGIHNSQRCLAEITEMIYMGSLIHKGILDLKTVEPSDYNNMDQGNKLAVLCGDYLLASACTNLSKLKNTQVVDLMSQVIADISESLFIDNENSKVTYLKLWYETLNSLLANSAKSAMMLVSQPPKLQQVAWNFAMNLDITYKIWSDLREFKKDESVLNKSDTILNAIFKDKYEKDLNFVHTQNNTEGFSLVSSLYSTFSSTSSKSLNQNLVKNIFTDCKFIFQNHYKLAMESLDQLENEFSEKDAVASLKSILNVMKNTV